MSKTHSSHYPSISTPPGCLWSILGKPFRKAGCQVQFVRAICKCGYTAPGVRLVDVLRGKSKQCQTCAKARLQEKQLKHGESSSRLKKATRLYRIWNLMRRRCLDPKARNYKDYGSRGIRICKEWQEYAPFRDWAQNNGYSEGLTLDRKNNDGDYKPSNCRWLTRKEQNNNKRNNVLIKAFGEIKNATQWAADPRCSVHASNIKRRIKVLGWTNEDAITTPNGSTNPNGRRGK